MGCGAFWLKINITNIYLQTLIRSNEFPCQNNSANTYSIITMLRTIDEF